MSLAFPFPVSPGAPLQPDSCVLPPDLSRSPLAARLPRSPSRPLPEPPCSMPPQPLTCGQAVGGCEEGPPRNPPQPWPGTASRPACLDGRRCPYSAGPPPALLAPFRERSLLLRGYLPHFWHLSARGPCFLGGTSRTLCAFRERSQVLIPQPLSVCNPFSIIAQKDSRQKSFSLLKKSLSQA